MQESGEALVDTLGISEGLEVLDLGSGRRTTAVPAARLGANVLGVDIASNLVEAGNARAAGLGLSNCRFQQGDATDLEELGDESFDLVVSIFGAMFASRPFDVAKEVVRVTRPGGRIIMGKWIPNDPTLVAQILKISSAYSPPPPQGFVSPMTWGVESEVIERFTAAGVPEGNIYERDTYTFTYPGAPSEFLAEFRAYYGPTMNAYDAAAKDGREDDLHSELETLFNSQIRSGNERRPRSLRTSCASAWQRRQATPRPATGSDGAVSAARVVEGLDVAEDGETGIAPLVFHDWRLSSSCLIVETTLSHIAFVVGITVRAPCWPGRRRRSRPRAA